MLQVGIATLYFNNPYFLVGNPIGLTAGMKQGSIAYIVLATKQFENIATKLAASISVDYGSDSFQLYASTGENSFIAGDSITVRYVVFGSRE